METKLIYGIQQIGVGVDDADKAFEWYATRLGSDIRVFEDLNTAVIMAPYMGGRAHEKKAILAINLQGGAGYELWQYLDRKPKKPFATIETGDLGINTVFVKARSIEKTRDKLMKMGEQVLTPILKEPDNKRCFYLNDLYGNALKLKEFNSWYTTHGSEVGGSYGCAIGVADISKSLKLYRDILGYNKIIYDLTGVFQDLKHLPGGHQPLRRLLLTHTANRVGGFSRLLGASQIELIQKVESKPNKIFQDRYWGDMGFIHLCFDIRNMDTLAKECADKGFPFKVMSGKSFDMGDANGRWGYIEDCDGTLIEFVETHRVPIIQSLGLAIDLKKRKPEKPVPDWMVRAMKYKRVRRFSKH